MVMMLTTLGVKPCDLPLVSTASPGEVRPVGSTGMVTEIASDRLWLAAHERTDASAWLVRVMSVVLVSSAASMSKSRCVTLNVVTTASIWVAAAAADEHALPRSVPPLSLVKPPKEMLTSPPAARRLAICDCQLDVLNIDQRQPAPSTNARVKNLVPVLCATDVSVTLLSPVST